MLECLNKGCQYNKNEKCGIAERGCYVRTVPKNILNEKLTIKDNSALVTFTLGAKEPINYEEEYKKQKGALECAYADIKTYKKENESLQDEIKELRSGRDTLNKRLDVAYEEKEKLEKLLFDKGTENSKLREDNKMLNNLLNIERDNKAEYKKELNKIRETNSTYYDEYKDHLEMIKSESEKYQSLLRDRNQEYKGLKAENEEYKTILGKAIDIAEEKIKLKEEIDRLNTIIDNKDNTMAKFKNEADKYYHKWIESNKNNKGLREEIESYWKEVIKEDKNKYTHKGKNADTETKDLKNLVIKLVEINKLLVENNIREDIEN
jgi:DNA repair exonuclease SbcCD ATPase subunit